jgi:hypothetical protein
METSMMDWRRYSNPSGPYTLATHGKLKWIAYREDAGPYEIICGTRLTEIPIAGFGTRSLNVEKPRSAQQEESFAMSRATFQALALMDVTEFERCTEQAIAWGKQAAKAARAEWAGFGVGGFRGQTEYERAVIRRFLKAIGE